MSIAKVLDSAGWVLAVGPLVLLLPVELWQRARAGRLDRASVYELLASASPLVPTLVLSGVLLSIATALFGPAAALAPWRIPTGWGSALACLALIDFLYYWEHRFSHRIRLLWAVAHSVHHSSPQFDQTTGLRVSFTDGFVTPWFYLPAVLAGFEPLLVAACFTFMVGYQQWLHTEVVGKLGWFDRIFNSPSNHRAHHAMQAQYLDKNYGGILMIWDRLFGTYQPEDEPPIYGITHPLRSVHPVRVHCAEALRLLRELRRARGASTRLRLLFGPPSEPPAGEAAGAAEARTRGELAALG